MSSAKERVLAVYPDAHAAYYLDGAVAVIAESQRNEPSSGYIGWGQTTAQKSRAGAEADAWEDAASRLPSSQVEGATQTENERLKDLEDALERIASFGEKAKEILIRRRIIFERFPRDMQAQPPAGEEIWEALAFTLYTDLWEASTIAATAVALRDDNKEAKHG